MASSSPFFFFLLCVLLVTQIVPNSARYIAQKTSSYEADLGNLFFRFEDMKIGNKFLISYPRRTVEKKVKLLPREEAETIPFSSKHLPLLLKAFDFEEDSPQAQEMAYTLQWCERRHAETRFCTTSLESMLDQVRGVLGHDGKINILTTRLSPDHKMDIQNYTIVEEPEPIVTEKVIGCHNLAFPFRVYFCHAHLKDHKVFKIKLVGDDGERIESPGLCHTDTSGWNPNHVALKMLKTEPGKSTVCHFYPADNFLWIGSPNPRVMEW